MNYLKLIRFQNLILLAAMQLVLHFGFLKFQNIPLGLSNFNAFLLALTTVCIAAGGYIINNIMDVETDAINCPKKVVVGTLISEAKAYNIYMAFTFTGVAIGFYLANLINKPGFAAMFIVIAATLYFYAVNLKQSLLIGNILVALLLSFSILIVGIFDLLPVTDTANQPIMGMYFKIVIDYAFFGFLLNFIREIVKDLEDYDGDANEGMQTLPIVLGISRTTKLVFVVSFLPIIAVLYYLNMYVFSNKLIISTLYCLIFILAPLLYFTVKIWSAKTKSDFSQLSLLLKWIVFFGVVSIGIISYNILHHA